MSITSRVLRRAAWVSVALAALLAGCNKPSEENCRKALSNIRHLLGTEHLSQASQSVEGEVRRCRGGSKRASVECAMKATTIDELRACKLMEIPASLDSGSGSGSAAAPAAPAPATEPAAAPAAPTTEPAAATTEPAAPTTEPAAPPATPAPATPADKKPATEVPAAPAKETPPPAAIAPGEPAPPPASIAPGEPAPPPAAVPAK